MSFRLLVEAFINPDSVQAILSATFLAMIHFVVNTDPVRTYAGYGSVILGLAVGFLGALKMLEMYRLQKVLRQKAEIELKKLKESEEINLGI